MLAEFTAWLFDLVKAVFNAAWQFIVDLVATVLDAILGALAALLALIPLPSFLSDGLQSLYGQLDPGIGYVLSQSGLPAALAIIGSAYVFRLARKFATLFQW